MHSAVDTLMTAVAASVADSGLLDSRARVATVSAVATDGTITVAVADGTIPRVRLLSGYASPTVGDLVVILSTVAGWVCLGATQTTTHGAWTNYPAAWIGSGTGPTLGNGSIAGRYQRCGRTITGSIIMAIGSTSTGGTGAWEWTLPAPVSPNALMSVFVCEYIRTGTNVRFDGHGVISPGATAFGIYLPTNSSTTSLRRAAPTAGPLSPASGATYANSWAATDTFRISFSYEAAD